MTAKNYIKFDLMRPIGGGNERFVATMQYPYSPMFKFDFKALKKWIEDKRPSLIGKPYNVYTNDDVVKVLYFNQSLNQIMRQNRWKMRNTKAAKAGNGM